MMEIAVQVELAHLGFSQFPTLALYHPRPTSGCSSCGHVVVCSTDADPKRKAIYGIIFPKYVRPVLRTQDS